MVERALIAQPFPDDVGVWLVAAGKAAASMAVAAERALGRSLRGGLVVGPPSDREAVQLPSLTWMAGGHPVPDGGSERAGRRALAIAGSVGVGEQLLVLVSGGASALMAVPAAGLSLEDKQRTTALLLREGADIQALNSVRKHLSAIKGGRLAARAAGPTRTFLVSDVVGDDPSVIGSGPTVPDPSTYADALSVVERLGGRALYPARAVSHLMRGAAGQMEETPKPGDAHAWPSEARVIGGRLDAMRGAVAEASRLGYHVVALEAPVVGEARDAAPRQMTRVATLAAGAPRPLCVVSSGETTVRVTGTGRGGRNQEFALAAAPELAAAGSRGWDVALASVGTDGIDGPTDAAGAIADSHSLERARIAGLPPVQEFLARNDAYGFFDRLGDLVRTGPTGTNVGDLQVLLLL